MPKDDIHAAMHTSEHSIKLPKQDKSKKLWIILCIVLLLALIGAVVYGYTQMQNYNKKIDEQQAKIKSLEDTKKTLEDAATATAKVIVEASTTNYLEVKELGYKLPLSDDIKDLQYFVNGTDTFFSTGSLQSKAWAADKGDPGKYCSLGTGPLGVISKLASGAPTAPKQRVLKAFVLEYQQPQADCSDSKPVIDLQTTQKASLLKAFEKAKQI
ncbi:hypothetical protein EXS66_01145 [Candidatus Saccharibacteria bacterium]|nr:hypothetical protein [Candidatus Saccharibacteria bacterium]